MTESPETAEDDEMKPSAEEGSREKAPDAAEEELGDEIDNAVPTRGLSMLPVVGIGGSAGSIDALQRFFSLMSPTSGMAFVVVVHLSPEHDSILAELLQKSTSMQVIQAYDSVKLLPDSVYVIPPGKHLSSMDGRLQLTELNHERGRRVAVDLFFRTLADTHGPHSAAVVLSGADGDGAIGIKRIKERGGLTIAQDPAEADFTGMPHAAIDTGMVDWVLPVEQIPSRLLSYRQNGTRLKLPPEDGPQPGAAPEAGPADKESALREILLFLRTRTGRDFSYYKRATILRRISRRMQVNGVEDLAGYLLLLRTHPGEATALLQDLLISVTNFFRDREAFEALAAQIPFFFRNKGRGDFVRVWVPGCATGEEAYSIAILLLEYARTLDSPPGIQIFASDLDEHAVQKARDGLFPETIVADVSEERLRKFFTQEHRHYRVRSELREMVLFALHDLVKESPFSRLDLISCRNLLIYLNADAQRRTTEIFHFALNEHGRLFLGTSESLDESDSLFTVVDKKHRIYCRRAALRPTLPAPMGTDTLLRALEAQHRGKTGPVIVPFPFRGGHSFQREAVKEDGQRVSWEELHFKLIEPFGPASLIVGRDYDILHLAENATRFLHFTGGEP
ncbi:MAG TPA: chemotaxis protein CheB, partial [Verrucomicrobiales bacterium]|nr:chemotaxis protein CheB [Verrucomicrobiales bacterium]